MEVLMDRAWAGIDAGKEVHWAYLLDTSGWKKLSRMMSGGNKNLKRVFYQVAFASLRSSPESRAFYHRKREPKASGTSRHSSREPVGG
jgi:hypothetical protein